VFRASADDELSVWHSTLNNFLSRRVNKWVTENLKILTYLSGRGVFYIFIGTLELGFYFSILHLVIGIILVSRVEQHHLEP
jgi:hypothetical protein